MKHEIMCKIHTQTKTGNFSCATVTQDYILLISFYIGLDMPNLIKTNITCLETHRHDLPIMH
jgi:hypothetical protein